MSLPTDYSTSTTPLIDPGLRKLLIRGGFGLAAILAIIALKFELKPFLITTSKKEYPDLVFRKLSFADTKRVIGLRQRGAEAVATEWVPETGAIRDTPVAIPSDVELSSVRMAPDLSAIAWLSGKQVWFERPGRDQGPRPVRLPREQRVMDITLLSGGGPVVIFGDGAMLQYDPIDLEVLESFRLSIQRPDQLAADQEYIAAASSLEGRLVLYRQVEGRLRIVEEARCPPPPFRLVLPGHGQAALMTPGGFLLNGANFNTPGAVRTLAFGLQSALVATGDFDGVYTIPRDEKPEKIAAAGSGALMAASDSNLVVGGERGTTVLNFALDYRLNDTGRNLMWAALIFLLLAILMLLDKLIIGIIRRIIKRGAGSGVVALKKFPAPPPELIESAIEGKLVLWAGSGLSAQCGLLMRRDFVRHLIEALKFEGVVSLAEARPLEALWQKGKAEEAMDAFIHLKDENRGRLLSFLRSTYTKTVAMSRAHDALMRIPFSGAITTNYDLLLDTLQPHWGRNVVTSADGIARARVGNFFLLKLYGEIPQPHTLLFSRGELKARLTQADSVAPAVRHALETTTLLFTGASLEGLLEDLPLFQPPQILARKHFVLAAVNDQSWKAKAAELQSKWGIEVFPCSSDQVAGALPEFLEALASKIAEQYESKSQAAAV